MKSISVITVCFNAEDLIERTILSVLNQTYHNIEYIIIDGDSTDGSKDIITKYKDGIDRYVSEKDDGIYDAMNKGLTVATGDFVSFLNAGDTYSSKDILKNAMEKFSTSDLIYGETNLVTDEGEIKGTRSELTTRKLPDHLAKNSFLDGQPVSHQSFIPRRKLCPKFDLRYQCSSDIDWMIQITIKASAIQKLSKPISNYLLGGISDRKLKKCWKERFMIMSKYFGIFQTLAAHVYFAIRYIIYGAYKTKRA